MKHLILYALLGCFTSLHAQKKHNFKIGNPEIVQRIEQLNSALVYKNHKFSASQQAIIDKFNTSKDSKYHSFEESEFILMTNLVRTDFEFFKTYVALQYDSFLLTKFSNISVKNLPRKILHPSKGLYKSAKVHAIKSGKNGTIGHQNLDKRIKLYNGKKFLGHGENCAYENQNSAVLQLILLLNSPPHLSNMLNSKYTHIGVSIQPHVKYTYNLVSAFGISK